MPDEPIEIVKRTASRIAEDSPAVRWAMPTSSTTVAISQTRPRVVAAMIPIARWRLPFFSASVERRWASHWIPRWASHAKAAAA